MKTAAIMRKQARNGMEKPSRANDKLKNQETEDGNNEPGASDGKNSGKAFQGKKTSHERMKKTGYNREQCNRPQYLQCAAQREARNAVNALPCMGKPETLCKYDENEKTKEDGEAHYDTQEFTFESI
ncbi:MAG: hypothetical protein ACRD4I_05805 [Candidatus Angelobacter sp.]